MTRKSQTLKKVKSQKKSKSQLRKTRKVRKHRVNGGKVPSLISPLFTGSRAGKAARQWKIKAGLPVL
jgi:hypothetical protein